MLFGKKTAITLSSLVFLSIVSACSSNVVPSSVSLKGDSNFQDSNLVTRLSSTVTQSKQDPSHFFIDAGNGQKTGVSISMKLNLGTGGDFKVKAGGSADGTPQKVVADLAKLKVALIEGSETAPPSSLAGALDIGSGTDTGHVIAGKTGSSPTITFTNVPANSSTTDKAYWIAVSALDSLNADITNKVSHDFVGSDGNYYYVSDANGGVDRLFAVGDPFVGEDATASVGSIQVAQDATANAGIIYVVSSLDTLGMTLKLQDATGAKVDSLISVTDGSDMSGSITAQ